MKLFLNIALSLVLLGGGGFTAWWLVNTRPAPRQKKHVDKGVPVTTVEARPATHRMTLVCMGSVIPARTVTVNPEVTGRLVSLSGKLVPGGIVSAGEELLRIDPRDYRFALSSRQADLARTELELRLEEGRGAVARREWDLLEKELSGAQDRARKELALRKPQLANARAARDAALAMVEKARLDLERTTLVAPFNALVREESVEVGQLVTPQTRLATLVGTDHFWVRVAVPVGRLRHVHLPVDGEEGAAVRIVQETAAGPPLVRRGRVIRLLGDLEPVGRMARLLIGIVDPLGLKGRGEGKGPGRFLPLLLDSYIRAEIDCGPVARVYRLPRTAVREEDRLWLMDQEERLEIRPVEIAWKDRDHVYLRDGLESGERVVTSNISVPAAGIKLRPLADKAAPE